MAVASRVKYKVLSSVKCLLRSPVLEICRYRRETRTGTRHQLIGWPVISTESVKMMKRLYNDVRRDIMHNGEAYFSNNGPRFTRDALLFTLIYRIRGNVSLEKLIFTIRLERPKSSLRISH